MSEKSKQYTSAQGYRDEDGMSRNFTFIDYDSKSKVSGYVPDGNAAAQHKMDREKLINKILDMSASLCPMEYYDFTIRGEDSNSIEWNQVMVKDEGVQFDKLQNLLTILRNRKDAMIKTY